ncbi:DNA-methyltransferase [[Mycoplasma] collis]|uniref:DNA-methyltransferase n=1 Tax=[Mycoplasma] collis TaxID=2127 RepID=UPI00051B01EC|nr:site-specific DNA-methyltransferase [[Mycoplasma] collis]
MDLINKIIIGDSIEELKKIPNSTFDFCFVDPPYFLQLDKNKKLFRVEGKEFKGCDDEWDVFPSMDEYKKWTFEWLKEVKRVLKDNGSICLISGMQSIYEIGSILRNMGFWIINDIIWKKSNPTPNFKGTRLNNSHETLIFATKSKKSKFTFNYKTGKYLNNGKQMGSVWTFPVCSGKERLKNENNEKVHNTQKPEALLYRIITLFTKKNDLILDPFAGTMTTAVVAKQTGRNYTMIEKSEYYVKYGKIRLDKTQKQIGNVENAVFDIKPIKVNFSSMVEKNFFFLNEKFYHKNGQSAELVDPKGKLKYKNDISSMHEIAAKMMNRNLKVNAYDYLFVKRNEKLISIAKIREDYRKILKAN